MKDHQQQMAPDGPARLVAVIGYARSIRGGPAADSVDSQQAANAQWATETLGMYGKFLPYSDEDDTGGRLSRPGLSAAREFIRTHRGGIVVAREACRIVTDSALLAIFIDEIERTGWRLVCWQQGIDTGDPRSRQLLGTACLIDWAVAECRKQMPTFRPFPCERFPFAPGPDATQASQDELAVSSRDGRPAR